jgi:hypothetical protein
MANVLVADGNRQIASVLDVYLKNHTSVIAWAASRRWRRFYDGMVTDEAQGKEYREQMLKETGELQRLTNGLPDLFKLQNPDFPSSKRT